MEFFIEIIKKGKPVYKAVVKDEEKTRSEVYGDVSVGEVEFTKHIAPRYLNILI